MAQAGLGAGVVFGLLEGALAPQESVVVQTGGASWRFTMIGREASYLPLPAIEGRF